MSRIVVRSETEQDAILLVLYGMASRHATNLLRRSCRDDVVQDLALVWLEGLRAGTFDVPGGDLDAFVFEAVLARATASAKRPGVIAEEYRPATHVSTPFAGARVATSDEFEATVDVHMPVRGDYGLKRTERSMTRQDLETIRDECEAPDHRWKAARDEYEAVDDDREAVADDRSVAANDRPVVADDRESIANDREGAGDDREGADDDCETTDNNRVTADNEWAAAAGARSLTDDDREATDTVPEATCDDRLVIAVV